MDSQSNATATYDAPNNAPWRISASARACRPDSVGRRLLALSPGVTKGEVEKAAHNAARGPTMHAPLNGPHMKPSPAPAAEHPLTTGPLAIVGGCGHVGLPLGLAFARRGHAVDLLDVSPERAA